MWWMVATLPSGGASEADLDLIVARAEIERLQLDVDDLSQEIATLHQERGNLTLRLDALEQGASLASAVPVQPTTEVAGPPLETATPEATPTADDDDKKPAPTASPTPSPTARATATPAPSSTPTAVQYFTDGRDRYNCRDFDSWEEAQAAYEANLPGDPNKIDIDRNGIACEALRR
jgi:hypothetical protein